MTLMMMLGLAGCPEEQRHRLLIGDVTGSGLKPEARLDAVAKGRAVSLVEDLRPGDAVTVYVFGSELTNTCEPIAANNVKQANSEEQDALKESLVTSLPATFDEYVACVRDEARGGSPGKGSPIFGALTEAVIKARAIAPLTTVELVTDGCSYGEQVVTCGPGMSEVGFAATVIEAIPTALRPDLSGVELVVTGLGQGTGRSGAEITVLRDIFTQYAEVTHAAGIQIR